jgi:UDP-N-acetylmuramoylalanine--D-glutamate ligase
MDLHGKRALVMGLGVHGGGLGVARFLAGQGAEVTVTDLRGPEQLQSSLAALAGFPIRFVLGRHDDDDFRSTDLVIRNPGVPRESRFLQIARAAGAAVEMEMTLFFRLCPGPILGITGTKGKTTTTLLAAALLREQWPDTVVAGNLRISALDALPQIAPTTPVVLELSSWQLEGLDEAGLSPRLACVTNLSPDHLDRYGSMEAYGAAKQAIFRHQGPAGMAVLNHDDPVVAGWAAFAPGQIGWFGRRAHAWPAGQPATWHDERGIWHAPAGGPAQQLVASDDIRLAGAHNRANVAAAAALALAFGLDPARVAPAVRGFGGVEHRLELVRELGGVRYVNDTAATAPEAAIAALGSFERPIVLIAGGADKQLPFEGLARVIAERAKAVVLLQGSATEKLARALAEERGSKIEDSDSGKDRGLKIEDSDSSERSSPSSIFDLRSSADRGATVEDGGSSETIAQSSLLHPRPSIVGPYGDFEQAIRAARELAAPGDVVLLAPGCASFGMFRNEFHRGEEFRRIVGELKDQ